MYKSADEFSLKKESLARDIIGEVAMAREPGNTLKKWRALFRISQKELASSLGVTSSVISDYESGRRKSPGILFLKRFVGSLMKTDEERGGELLRSFISEGGESTLSSAVADIREFEEGIGVSEFCDSIGAKIINRVSGGSRIYGYTMIDSVKAITQLSFPELVKLYGVTTQRALLFTNITTGKGPLIAIKVANMRPSLIVLHGLEELSLIHI